MSNLSKLEGIKRQAQKEGWAKFIRTEADEKALLKGFSFSFEHWDHFRFFCESFLVFNKGKWKGKGFEFLPYQEIICGSLFGWISTSDGYRRFKRAFIELPKKNGKALALDTDIPTPSGFKKIKDISVGDLVFGDDGKPTRVIAESPIFYGHDCFKLVFGNGQEVVADADHLWEVRSHCFHKDRSIQILTTRELFDHQNKYAQPLLSIRKAAPIQCEDQDLPLDPYLLGYWLGDGASASSTFYVGRQDIQFFEKEIILRQCQYSLAEKDTCFNIRILKDREGRCFQKELRKLNLLKNKHIPELYLFSSYESRLELLRGLLDSDGTCSKAGQVTFSSIKKNLAEGFWSLAQSLGIKCRLTKSKAKLKGRDVSDNYEITFFTDTPVFRNTRKLSRLRTNLHRTRKDFISIKSISQVESVPTKCLAVDNESHLFLITKSFLVTHNTTLSAAIGLYMFAGDGEAGAEVYNIANDRDQAALLWNVAADYVEANDYLKKLVTVTRSTRRMNINGKETFTAWSSDQTSKDGPNIHCAIIDELHEWQGAAAREMWRKIRYGAVARAQPLCPLVITTAGSDRQTLCYEQHQYAERILEGTAEDLSFFAMIFGADPKKIKADPDYWKSEEAFKEANPAYEIILKKEDFESDVIEVENDPVAKYGFFRYRLGIWTEGATPWIERTVWEACSEPYFIEEDLRGWPCFTGMDLSSVNDFTSVVHVFPYFCRESGVKKFRILPRFYCPEESFSKRVRNNDASLGIWHERGLIRLTPGSAIEHEEIFKDIEKDAKTFDIRQIGYDRYSAAWIIQQIQKILPEIELYPISQAITTISEPTKAFFTAITQGRIEHAGNPVLSWQVANAVPEENSNGDIKLSKSRSRDKIDGVIAAIMAFNQAQLGELEVKKKISVYGNPDFQAIIKKIEGARA